MKTMLLKLPNELHYAIKVVALEHNMTMKDWISLVIVDQLRKENKYNVTPAELDIRKQEKKDTL